VKGQEKRQEGWVTMLALSVRVTPGVFMSISSPSTCTTANTHDDSPCTGKNRNTLHVHGQPFNLKPIPKNAEHSRPQPTTRRALRQNNLTSALLHFWRFILLDPPRPAAHACRSSSEGLSVQLRGFSPWPATLGLTTRQLQTPPQSDKVSL